MKIIILGAGQVGSSVAENLVSEANDITVVDTDPHLLQLMQNRLDLRSVVGNAASPSVMRQAGADDADLLIAVTQSDQTNLCACRIARTLFNLPTRIARLRSADYVEYPELLDEQLRRRLLDLPRADRHRIHPQAHRVPHRPAGARVRRRPAQPDRGACGGGGPLVGHPLADLRRHIPNIDARIAAIYRGEKPIIPTGETSCSRATRSSASPPRAISAR